MSGHMWINKDGSLYSVLDNIGDSNLEVAKSNIAIADAINNLAQVVKDKEIIINNNIVSRRIKLCGQKNKMNS